MELAPRLADPECSYRGADEAEGEAGPAEYADAYLHLGHGCQSSQAALFFGGLSLGALGS
jgi:hypothetical protein